MGRVQQLNSDFLWTAVKANSPQIVLSILYVFYQSLFISMVGARDWSYFASAPQALQVTKPVGCQESTYYFQLPLFYALVCFPLAPLTRCETDVYQNSHSSFFQVYFTGLHL